MRRAPAGGIDLSIYAKAIPLLLRNPSIIVVPLLMAVAGVLVGITFSAGSGAVGVATSGLAGLIVALLELFGLAVACIIADDAWRQGRASFERGWTEARRRSGEILYVSFGLVLLMTVAQFTSTLLGSFALILMAAVVLFFIWAVPATAVGGVPGVAAIGLSVERVRASPISSAVAAVVTIALVLFVPSYAGAWIALQVLPYTGGSIIAGMLITALIQAIAIGYVALVLTKTYTDAAFGRRS
jgi:hypothetical protein